MKSVKPWCIAATAALAMSSVAVLGLADPASAVTTPATAITHDANASRGTLTFYNAAGQVITSGTNLTTIFKYAAASAAGRTHTTKATVYFAFPDHSKPDSTTWFQSQTTASTVFPNTAAPSPVKNLANPVATAGTGDANLAGLLPTTTQDHTSGYDGILQIRLKDSGPGVPVQNAPFFASDIYYNQSANTWQQVYPASATATSVTKPAASHASPAPTGTSVTLTSTVSAANSTHPAGSVHLFDGTTDRGAATFTASTGAVTDTLVPTTGSHSFTFVFTPTSSSYASSTSPALTFVEANAPGAPTAVHATAGHASAAVSWTAPSSTGGTAITAYDVEYSSNSGGSWSAPVKTTSAATSYTVTGLTNGTSYVFRVAAIAGGGVGAYSAASTAVKPFADATALTISKSTTIVYGKSTSIVAGLTDTTTKAKVSGAKVTLYSRTNTSKPYASVASAKTNSSGAASISVAPNGTTSYQWQFAATTTYAAATSAADTVSVSAAMAVKAKPGKAKTGKAFKVYGTASPSVNKIKMTLQVKVGSKYKTIGHVSTKKQKLPNGKTKVGFVFSIKEKKKGTYSFRVLRAATSTVAAGKSKAVKVKVV